MMERLRSVVMLETKKKENRNENKERKDWKWKERREKGKNEKQVHQYCRIIPITCCVLNTISGNPRKKTTRQKCMYECISENKVGGW